MVIIVYYFDRCHHWKRHIQNETIDYYFLETESESESKGETKMTMRLVRVVESNVGYGRDSVFDYFGFRTNKIPSMEEMQPPLGKLKALSLILETSQVCLYENYILKLKG